MTGHYPKTNLSYCRQILVWWCLRESRMQDSLDERDEERVQSHHARR